MTGITQKIGKKISQSLVILIFSTLFLSSAIETLAQTKPAPQQETLVTQTNSTASSPNNQKLPIPNLNLIPEIKPKKEPEPESPNPGQNPAAGEKPKEETLPPKVDLTNSNASNDSKTQTIRTGGISNQKLIIQLFAIVLICLIFILAFKNRSKLRIN